MARRASSLGSLSVDVLRSEIRRRERSLKTLQRKRARLAAKLARVDAKIAAAGGSAGQGRGRARNSTPLVPAMVKALGTKTMGVSELADAVQKAGYRTNAANFRVIVNAALLKHKKVFKNVSRGKYSAV
ncbi:MAG TPA: hypothetical protein VHN77_03150 [Phycisphaerales bacterium]|nr:hypothetical protein [Phycisphaerales bacterium]